MYKLINKARCKLTRHHWLLTDEVQHDVSDQDLLRLYYTCQVCKKEIVEYARYIGY